jgi:hypothetical protein
MPNYTLRHTSLSGNPNDYVFRCDGIEVGRCYLRTVANNEQSWLWTIYIGIYALRRVEGVPISGNAKTLEQATAEFRFCFEQMILAGVVSLPEDEDSTKREPLPK